MKVCLINPPSTMSKRNEDREYDNTFYTLPHAGLGYIGAVLEKDGFSVDIIECVGQEISLSSLIKKIQKEQYSIIGISTYFYNYIYVAEIVKKVKKINPNAFIMLGGYLPTLNYETILNSLDGVNCCVIGEGEYTCLELAAACRENKNWRTVHGIAYKENNEIVMTPARPLIENLDELPIAKRAFIARRRMTPIVTSRGCYGSCIYCGIREFYSRLPGPMLRRRSPESVVDEMEYLINKYNIRYFHFNDDNFLSGSANGKKWLDDFYNLVKERNIKFTGRIFVRANDLIATEEYIDKLKEIGIIGIFIGIESLVQRQLDFYNKKMKVQQNINALDIACKHDLKISAGFMMFDPFTTLDELLENVTLLKSTDFCNHVTEEHLPLSAKIPATPIPGTKFYDLMKDKGLLINSELSYEFQDEGVALCHNIIKIWNAKVFPVYFKHYYISMAQENGEPEIEQLLRKEKTKLIMLDLDFVEKLILKVKNKEVDMNNCNDFIHQYEEQLQDIYNKFMEAGNLLSKYEIKEDRLDFVAM